MVVEQFIWLIPLFPLLAFAVIVFGGYRHKKMSHMAAILGVAAALVVYQIIFWSIVIQNGGLGPEIQSISWINLGSGELNLGTYIDASSALMLFVVPVVCLVIFIYSIGYLGEDPSYSRFFAYVSLFAFAMLGLVICDNLIALFMFWELMGVCSYLLIGFWSKKPKAVAAALKAFFVTKIGDILLLLGMLILYSETGTLAYGKLFDTQVLQSLASTPYFNNMSVATVVALLLFAGTIGKSAQFPLHVWLPDAMAGPTPASALIHAATMVTAGIFLIIRMFPLLLVSQILPVIAIVGTFTALFAAIIAMTQDDIKRVLAYSTISQLGYMVAAVGVGAYKASLFHLLTHAFFKALLFLAAGSVIESVEHGFHVARGHALRTDSETKQYNPNSMAQMGGLMKRMPVTAIAYAIGAFTLAGFPLITSAFWSKDAILTQAWFVNRNVFWGLAAAAIITAFYIVRQLSLVFFGNPRSQSSYNAHENGNTMIIPLLILAFFSVIVGWVGIPEGFPVLSHLIPDLLEKVYEIPAFILPIETLEMSVGSLGGIQHFAWIPFLIGISFPILGGLVGWLLYGRVPLEAGDEDPLAVIMRFLKLKWLYRMVQNSFYLDNIYMAIFVKPLPTLINLSSAMDIGIIDRFIQATGKVIVHVNTDIAKLDEVSTYLDVSAMQSINVSSILAWIDGYIVDEVVNIVGYLGGLLSRMMNQIDERLIDGIINQMAQLTRSLGLYVRKLQNGLISDYLWNAFLMVLLIIASITLLQ